jgi:hypothetical protein
MMVTNNPDPQWPGERIEYMDRLRAYASKWDASPLAVFSIKRWSSPIGERAIGVSGYAEDKFFTDAASPLAYGR